MSVIKNERRGGGGLQRVTTVYKSRISCKRCGVTKTVRKDRIDPAIGYYCRDCGVMFRRAQREAEAE